VTVTVWHPAFARLSDRAAHTLGRLRQQDAIRDDDRLVIARALAAAAVEPDPAVRARAIRAGAEALAVARRDLPGDPDDHYDLRGHCPDLFAGMCPAATDPAARQELWMSVCDAADALADLRRDGPDDAFRGLRPEFRDRAWQARVDDLDSDLDGYARQAGGEN
jgi:hypothetical protein